LIANAIQGLAVRKESPSSVIKYLNRSTVHTRKNILVFFFHNRACPGKNYIYRHILYIIIYETFFPERSDKFNKADV